MNLEIQKYIKEYVDRMQAKGITPTIEQINAHLANLIRDMNNAPKEGFEGYSSSEISKVLYEPFDIDSVLQFNPLTSEQYNQMPIFRQVKYLLQTLAEHEIKLTAAGFLPPSLVKVLYPLGVSEYHIDNGLSKLSKEADSNSVTLARYITTAAGLIKVRKGVLSLTTNGFKIMNDDAKLFKHIFEAFCLKFNWGYFDGYKSEQIGRLGFGFTFILLSKYGNLKREDTFYAQKYFNAFPLLMDGIDPGYGTVTNYCESCYSVRTFERFMLHFALVEMPIERRYNISKFITKTVLFDSLIQILPHKESK